MSQVVTFFTERNVKAKSINSVFGSGYEFRVLYEDLPNFQLDIEAALAEKCETAIRGYDVPCPIVTDITTINFNALNGLPGFLTPSFAEKMKSYQMYKMLDGWEDKSAYVMYYLGLLEEQGSRIRLFQGYLSGSIVEPHRSDAEKMGWEYCFHVDDANRRYSDLSQDEREAICERKKALRALKTYLISKEFFS